MAGAIELARTHEALARVAMRVAAICCALLSTPAGAWAQPDDGWYTLNSFTERCDRSEEGPAGLIRSIVQLGGRYIANDVTDPTTGQIVRVAISLPDLRRETIFYRGALRCQAQLDAILAPRRAEQQRVEDRYRLQPATPPPEPARTPGTVSASPAARPQDRSSSSVLDTLDRLRNAQQQRDGRTGGTATSRFGLTASELRGFADQISECWSGDAGASDLTSIVVELRITGMDAQGNIRNVGPGDRGIPSDARARAVYEAARRAMLNPRCNPPRVPPEKLNALRDSVFRFNPRGPLAR